MNTPARRWRRAIVSVAVASATAASIAVPSAAAATAHAGAANTAKATAVVNAALKGAVSAANATKPLTPLKTFNGLKTEKPVKLRGVSMIGVASCVNPCNYVGSLVGAAAKSADGASYTGSVGNTPEDWQSLVTQAINKHPKVIVFNGVSDGAVLQQVATARKAGIKTVGISVERTVPASQGYDAYVSVRQDLSYRLMMDAALADSKGKANVVLFEPSGYASTDKYVAAAKAEFLKQCPTCTLVVQKEETGSMADPTSFEQIVTSTLNANPKANYLLFGDDFYALSAAQQAVQTLNRKVTMIAQDGSTVGLAAVKAGILKYDAAVPLQWIADAGYDAIRRLLSGQKLASPDGWGGGVHLFDAGNLPKSITNPALTSVWSHLVNYAAGYKKLWSAGK